MKKDYIYPSRHIYWLDWTATDVAGRAVITRAEMQNLEGYTREVGGGRGYLCDLFQNIVNMGARVVWVWDMAAFGAFCDYYALRRGLPNYNDLPREERGRGCPRVACYNILYAAQGVLMFRLTLPRSAMTHSYKHGRIGGMHTVEFRGLSSFLRGRTYAEACKDFHGEGIALYRAFNDSYAALTGDRLDNPFVLRNVYTLGGAARREYLNTRYGSPSLKKYHKEHPQEEAVEDYFRARRLLLGGMCFFDSSVHEKLVEGGIVKYDINSLYPWAACLAGELAPPELSTMKEFNADHSGGYAYIIVLSDCVFFKRDHRMPNVFSNPFTHYAGDVQEFCTPETGCGEWAVFGELFRALQKFYHTEEFNIVKIFKCKRRPDPAIVRYVDKFYKIKTSMVKEHNDTMRLVAKLFLNGLCGKFSQDTKYVQRVARYDKGEDCIIFDYDDLRDCWDASHFDYIRGAYIYTLARVRVMNDIYNLWRDAPDKFIDIYTDTDCIFTQSELPAEMVDCTRLGAYKREATYSAMGVVAHKVYYVRSFDGEDKVTAAGVKRGEIVAQVRERLPSGATAVDVWERLTAKNAVFTTPVLIRVPGGALVKNVDIRMKDINISDIL